MKKVVYLLVLLFILLAISPLFPDRAQAQASRVIYTYDERNQLTEEVYDDGTTVTYTYDAAGNLTRRVVSTGNSRILADLVIVKTAAPNPVTVGNNLTYAMVVTNNGPTVATGVNATDTLPIGVTFVSAASTHGTCTQSGGNVSCNLGTLTSSSRVTITIVVTTTTVGVISNTAAVAGNEQDPNTSNNTATATTTVSPPSSTLTVAKAGTGSGTVLSSPAGVDCGTACSASYNNGTAVQLTATPAARSVFASWAGCDSVVGDSCTVTMNTNRTVTVTFNPQPPLTFTLTVTKAGTGSGTVTSNPMGVDCGTDCSANYDAGTSVTLTPIPMADFTFAGWSGDPDCADGVVTIDASKTCMATFDVAATLVKDINPGSGHSSPTSLTNVNGTLFFTADDGTNGQELWKMGSN
jgi:uncharacterized repeat protein (TIGR01451 family)